MFKLVHLSDIHLHPLPKATLLQLASKRITGFLNWKLNRKSSIDANYLDRLLVDMQERDCDHTIITGDLVNLALPAELENARDFLETLGGAGDVTVQFGNHDAYVPGALKKAMSIWHPYACGDEGPLSNPDDFPILRIRGDVAIIACNSAVASLPFMATGRFGAKQANQLARILKITSNLCRVVCIHHPPIASATRWHKRLIGLAKFQDVIKEFGAELVLHGHTHLATINSLESPSGNVPVVGVPAAGNGHGNSRPAGRYNTFYLSKKGNDWNIKMEARACSRDGLSVETVKTLKLA